MIFADKIIKLRKKNGWSQEELADKMDVSRQAVSKWESAQAIPDLARVLKLGELFGVTTDFLLKDEIEDEQFNSDASCSDIKRVSVEEANSYMDNRIWASVRIALATLICIISPIPLLILGAATELPSASVSEQVALSVGLGFLFVTVALAVATFIYCGYKNSPYEFLEKSVPFELEYGVKGIVTERKKQYRSFYMKSNIIATCICIVSPIPLFVGAFFETDFLAAVMLTVTMLIAGIGVALYVTAGVRWACFQKLLKEGEYTIREKQKSGVKEAISTAYWLIVTAAFLLWSFLGDAWKISWVTFVIGGILYAAIMAICNVFLDKNISDDNK